MSKKLAIKGHPTRGKEVIELLEMLGGKNNCDCPGDNLGLCYLIDDDFDICAHYFGYDDYEDGELTIFTLEEFLEKYPFKVGDKVFLYDNITEGCVTGMKWEENTVKYCVYTSAECWCDVKELLKWNAIDLVEKHYGEQCEEMTKDITLKHLYELGMKNIKDNFETKTPNNVNDKLECKTENIFGYKPDDIVFVNEINWVKITNKFWDSYKKDFFYKGVGLFNQKVYDNISQKSIKAQILLSSFNINNNNEHNSIDRYVNDICDDILINQISNKVAIINLKSDVCDDEVELNLGDYEIKIRDNKTYAVLKKPKYPKTYKECCDVLLIPPYYNLRYHTYEHCYNEYATSNTLLSLEDKLNTLGKLIICRDAYWKIAGEEMGLGKPWEPKFGKYILYSIKFYLYQDSFVLHKGEYSSSDNCILVFPTEEMRDAFYEDFKHLIEQCKELL